MSVGRIKKIGGSIRSAWLVLGAVFALLLVMEAGASFLLFARDTIKFSMLGKSRIAAETRYRTDADVYHGVDWAEDYYREYVKYRKSARWRSYITWSSGKFEGKHINVNEGGIRRTWNKNVGAGNESFKIFMFGGSTTWGYGVRDDFTIPSHLSRILSEQGFNVEVTNFGELAYVSTQEVIKLLLEIRSGNAPDVAIFYDGGNDVVAAWQNQMGGDIFNLKNRETEFNILKPWKKKELNQAFMVGFIKNSATYRLVMYLSMRITGRHFYDYSETRITPDEVERIAGEALTAYSMNVKLVEEVGKQVGFGTLFYWQPAVQTKPELTPYEKNWQDEKKNCDIILRRTYELVEKSDALHSNERFHDISRIFEDYKEPFFIDNLHISEKGNEIVAQKMAQGLSRILDSSKGG